MTDKKLAGRTALVTGAGRGIGRAVARRLAEDGAAVTIHYRTSEEGAKALVTEINDAGGRAMAVAGDLRDPPTCRHVVATAEEAFGYVGILVHNAGMSKGGPIMGGDFQGLKDTIDTNLMAALYCVSAAVPGMLRNKFGRVIAISSSVAESGGLQGQSAYAASKAGLIGFIKTLANELSPRADFTANVVSPGVIPTDLSAFGIEQFGEQLLSGIPLGRFGDVADVASAVSFLVSPEASYVNGHNFAVDGGYSLKFLSRRRSAK